LEEKLGLKEIAHSHERSLTAPIIHIIKALLILFSAVQLISTWFMLPSTHYRPYHVGLVCFFAFLLFPPKRKNKKDTLTWYDIFLAILSLLLYLYPIVFFERIAYQTSFSPLQIVIGAAAIVLLMEACRRVVGLPIVIVGVAFLLIGFLGRSLPGFLANRGFSIQNIIKHLFYTQEGVFGAPVGASSTFIFLFILFGMFLEATGVGEFFIDFSNALAGHKRGGPAKVAVITSAFEGTVSGSSVANTVGSGSFTIPMMKRLGYRPEFAAAVEASASTGGQLMPPVMGAAAFLMAQNLGVNYTTIIKSAIIPALLYFAGIYIIIDIEAKKQGLKGLEKEKTPRLKAVLLDRGFLILPLFSVIFVLTMGFTPSVAALVGIVSAVIGSHLKSAVNFLIRALPGYESSMSGITSKPHHGIMLNGTLSALEKGARSVISVALACGVAGIITGMITLTGIGLNVGNALTILAGNSIILLLVLTMFASLILGMGVPTTANYLITSTMMAPVVAKMMMRLLPDSYGPLAAMNESFALLPAHMFTFYFGIIADITPPVALAAMAGAAIANSNPFKTGVESARLAIGAFLVPFVFVMNPQMLMLNAKWYEVVMIVITSLIGMLGIGMAVEKFWNTKLSILEQLASFAGGIMLIDPDFRTDILGSMLVISVLIYQKYKTYKQKTA